MGPVLCIGIQCLRALLRLRQGFQSLASLPGPCSGALRLALIPVPGQSHLEYQADFGMPRTMFSSHRIVRASEHSLSQAWIWQSVPSEWDKCDCSGPVQNMVV